MFQLNIISTETSTIESSRKCQKGRIRSLYIAYVLGLSSGTHVDGWVTVTRVAVTRLFIGYLPGDWLADRPPGVM